MFKYIDNNIYNIINYGNNKIKYQNVEIVND